MNLGNTEVEMMNDKRIFLYDYSSPQFFYFYWKKWLNAKDIYNIKGGQYPNLNNYDLAFFYVMNAKLIKGFPKLKEMYSNIKLIVMVDSDLWWFTCPWYESWTPEKPDLYIKRLQQTDLVLALNPKFYEWCKNNNINVKLEYILPFDPYIYIPKINYSKRFKEKKVCILAHSMPNYKIDTNLEIAKRLGLKVVLIGTFHNKNILNHMLKNYKNAEVYERFKTPRDYMEKINECYLGLEDWYCGGSRFGIECGQLGIPVVGSRNALSLTIINPDLTCENADIKCLIEKASFLLNLTEQEYTELSKITMEWTRKYFSEGETKKRFLNVLKEFL